MKKCNHSLNAITFIFPLVFLLTVLSCYAPKDYYLELAKMEHLGAKLRQESGGIPSEQRMEDPVVLAFEPGQTKSELIQFDVRSTTDEDNSSIPTRIFRDPVPIAVNQEALKRTLNQKGIVVTEIRAVDDRLKGQSNILRIAFVPQAFSDEAVYEAYLLISAVVRGADTGEGTVDKVIGIVEDQSANTRMILEGQIQDYINYIEGQKISQQEWLKRLKIKRF